MYNETLSLFIIQSIGLGLVLSLVSSEVLGIAAGGMVVPGYVALVMHEPLRVIGTIAVSLATLAVLMVIKRYTFVYGRRRIVYTVLIGFILGWISRDYLVIHTSSTDLEFHSIGLIIPGLIANWMDRQGVVPTITMMIITATFVRLILVLVSGGAITLTDTVPL